MQMMLHTEYSTKIVQPRQWTCLWYQYCWVYWLPAHVCLVILGNTKFNQDGHPQHSSAYNIVHHLDSLDIVYHSDISMQWIVCCICAMEQEYVMYENASQCGVESRKGMYQKDKIKQWECEWGGMSPWWKHKSTRAQELSETKSCNQTYEYYWIFITFVIVIISLIAVSFSISVTYNMQLPIISYLSPSAN